MASKFIEIDVNQAAGVITYTDPATHANKQDVIEWKCQDGPFALQFKGATPVEFQGSHSTSNGAGAHVLRGKVEGNKGVYPYACAVYAHGEMYLDARCPVIIIDL